MNAIANPPAPRASVRAPELQHEPARAKAPIVAAVDGSAASRSVIDSALGLAAELETTRLPDYAQPKSKRGHQGWWRHQGTGNVIAVLGETTSSSGKPMAIAAKYNFNSGARGNGFRLLTRNLLTNYVQAPDNLDPG